MCFLLIGTTVVKFAPGAFEDTYEYIGKKESRADLELLNAYMTDDTGTIKSPGARFSKVPIINGPGKLSPFTLKTEVSIILHLTR